MIFVSNGSIWRGEFMLSIFLPLKIMKKTNSNLGWFQFYFFLEFGFFKAINRFITVSIMIWVKMSWKIGFQVKNSSPGFLETIVARIWTNQITHCQFFLKKKFRFDLIANKKKLRTQSRGPSRVDHAWALTKWARWVGFAPFFYFFKH